MTFILVYWPILSIVLMVTLFAMFFFAPSWMGVMAGIVFFLSLARIIFSVVKKQTKLYQERSTSRIKLALNVLFELIAFLLAMILAGLLGRYLAQIATQEINNDLIKFAVGIATGLLVGIGVGVIMQRIWGRFIKTSVEN